MKKAFFVLLSQLMIFSISATTGETNTPDSVQDSLIKRFLRFVPDSMAIESVIISDFKDEEVEESWILTTKAVGDDKEIEDGNIYWNPENEYCIDFGSRGFVVLFRYKGGEYYKAVEKYDCLQSPYEDEHTGFYKYNDFIDENVSLDKNGVLLVDCHDIRPNTFGDYCFFKYFNGEFKYLGHIDYPNPSGNMTWISTSDYEHTNHLDFIVTKTFLINGGKEYNENGDYNDDFEGQYIHYTYKIAPTYLPNIDDVNFYMGTNVENPDFGDDILKIEVDDYKIVDGEKQWYRREITEEEARKITGDDTQE